MEARAAVMDEALRVLDSALSHVQWRLKSSSKRRLEIDIIALCTGMRPVVMVDYGGKLPELQQHLCSLLRFCQKGSPIFEHLRVMLIQDMIYLIHKGGLAEHVRSSLSLEAKFLFVDLEQDPPAIIRQTEEKLVGVQLVSVQQLFSLHFPLEEQKISGLSCNHMTSRSNNKPLVHKPTASGMSEFIDLSSCMQDTKLSIPTLNGWLLGYPVVYMFSTDHIEDAICNLSTKSLQIFRVLVCRFFHHIQPACYETEICESSICLLNDIPDTSLSAINNGKAENKDQPAIKLNPTGIVEPLLHWKLSDIQKTIRPTSIKDMFQIT